MSTLRTKIESILIGLEQEYELASSLQTQMPSTIEFTSGENGAIASIIGFFSTAHSEIIGMIDDLSWSSEEGVLSMMKEMKKRQLKLRIIGKRGIDTEDDLIIFRASTGATVKSLPESEFASSFLIKDKSELIINVGLNTAGSESVPSTLIVRDPRLVQVFGGLFEESWKKALPLED